MKRLLCALAVLIAGCDQMQPNQEVRERVFFQCLQALPKGPESPRYNDWDEVVHECGSQAYYIAMRRGAR